jgi:hypothetical protein
VIRMSDEVHLPRKLYSEVLKERRRYELNEAIATDEDLATKNELTASWDYKVVRGKWDVPEKAKRIRKSVVVRKCHQRDLKKVIQGKDRRSVELDKDLQKTINELRKLRITEREEQPLEATALAQQITPEVSAEVPQRELKEVNGNQLGEMVTLRQLWKEFVLTVRVKQGWYEKLPQRGCFCGKARISYPHWPPSSEEEAEEQFNYCMNDQNVHRRNLVLRWWEHFNELANILTWNASERQSYYKEAAEMIRMKSLIVRKELERSLTHGKRPKSWSCESYCEKVLSEKQASCLCHCGEHRDKCPIHSY